MSIVHRLNDISRFLELATGLGHIRVDVVPAGIQHPDARVLEAYWRSKAQAGIPARDAIDPREIVPLLPNILIADPQGGGWRYRLFGTGMAARIGVDFTAKRVDAVYEPGTAKECERMYGAVARDRQPIHLRGRYLGVGIEHLTIEAVHFPIIGRDGTSIWIFGGVFFYP